MKEKRKNLKSSLSCAAVLALFSPMMLQKPESVQALPVASAATNVGITFNDGVLTLVSVPNFDFGANKLDDTTKFVPLYASASSTVGDPVNGAFMDQTSSASPTRTLRDSTKYRSLIVSDSRLPINSSGTYNGWTVSAHMTVGSAASLGSTNINSHVSAGDPNPDAGVIGGVAQKFAAAIEFGNGFGNSLAISSLTGGQAGNSTPVSHPATYYNSDPNMEGKSYTSSGAPINTVSRWTRVDTDTTDVPATDNSVSGVFAGLFFPRLAKTPIANNAAQITAVASSDPNNNNVANNSQITTIPMGNTDNYLWGYLGTQQTAAASSRPDSVSNGAWALDFHDKGSAIMSMPKAVALNRHGTYVYNIYWTLTSGFHQNP
ncbi:hypothetical protein [Xylocopilactobacillus apis]|uniref:WxL domain-containing protein n=1 Tax=Xylocopilactobacillus apis TaxID=2932183 RepID=A0AAU9CNX8_9LACO|nr:hypothetical protein [Xylocopilactobacillus apis]BDR55649.1 hypothetical protein KIMC2_02110 [Xylocopilactobacillus apis]